MYVQLSLDVACILTSVRVIRVDKKLFKPSVIPGWVLLILCPLNDNAVQGIADGFIDGCESVGEPLFLLTCSLADVLNRLDIWRGSQREETTHQACCCRECGCSTSHFKAQG